MKKGYGIAELLKLLKIFRDCRIFVVFYSAICYSKYSGLHNVYIVFTAYLPDDYEWFNGGIFRMQTRTEKQLFVGRREQKYYLSHPDALKLQRELDVLLERDSHSPKGAYRVKSLYFDSYQNVDYFEKLHGYEKRKKIRMRIYDEDASAVKLELKEKQGEYQHKHSLLLSREEAEEMCGGNYGVLLLRQEEIAHRIYRILRCGGYRPAAVVEYDRLAYIYRNYATRITFDSGVRSEELTPALFERKRYRRLANEDYVILEVKFNRHLAGFIGSVLQKYCLNQVSVSKYGEGRPVFAGKFVM